MKERLTYVNLQDGLEVHIAAGKVWPILVLMVAILYVWLRFSLGVPLLMLRGVLDPKSPVEFFFCLVLGSFFLLFFIGFGAPVLHEIGFQFFGEEVVRAEGGWLTIKKSLFGLGKRRKYPVNEISGLVPLEDTLQSEISKSEKPTGELSLNQLSKRQIWIGWLKRLGVKGITFRQGGSPHWFGSGLARQEVGELLTRLKFYLPVEAFVPTDDSQAG